MSLDTDDPPSNIILQIKHKHRCDVDEINHQTIWHEILNQLFDGTAQPYGTIIFIHTRSSEEDLNF